MFLSNTNIDATGLKPRFELDLNYPQRLDSNYPLDYPDSNCTRTQSKEFLDIQATIECICVYSLWNAYVTWQEYTDKYRFWTFFLHDLKWKKTTKNCSLGLIFLWWNSWHFTKISYGYCRYSNLIHYRSQTFVNEAQDEMDSLHQKLLL